MKNMAIVSVSSGSNSGTGVPEPLAGSVTEYNAKINNTNNRDSVEDKRPNIFNTH